MAVLNFSNNFSQKDCYKFEMAKNGCSDFFPTIFPNETGINLKWPKMALPNFFQQFFPERQLQIWNGQKWLFSNFFPTIFPNETGINLKWPKMAIPNFSNNFS